MNRRRFSTTLAALAASPAFGAAAADEPRRTRYYTFESFKYKLTSQGARMNQWLTKDYLPKLAKIHPGPVAALSAQFGPHVPETLLITGYASLDEFASVRSRIPAEPFDLAAEAPFDSQETALLEATEFSPEIEIRKHTPPRYFELRVYHAPTAAQLRALHDRFAGPEIKIFHQVGIFPMLYALTLAGPNMPNLVYLIPFDSLAARESAWAAFGSDPGWIKLNRDFTAKYGSVPTAIDVSIYRAAGYSPVS